MSTETEKDMNKTPGRQSRDSKWLLPCFSTSNEGHATRRNIAQKRNNPLAVKLRSKKNILKTTKKVPSKPIRKSTVRNESANSRKKIKISPEFEGKMSLNDGSPRKGKQNDKNGTTKETSKIKKKRTVSELNGSTQSTSNIANQKKGKAVKTGKLKYKPVKKSSKNDLGKKGGKASLKGKVKLETKKFKSENEKMETYNDANGVKVKRESEGKEDLATSSESDETKHNASGQNSIPSIEDELRIIEGGVEVDGLSTKLKSASVKAGKKKVYKRKKKERKELPMTRFCNLCPEAFRSELDLAHHCREFHFKPTLVFKKDVENGDERSEDPVSDFRKLLKIDTEKGHDDEHDYAKENEKDSGNKSKEVILKPDDESISVDTVLPQTDNDSPVVEMVEEPVVFVRKVSDKDRRYCPFCRKMFLSDKGQKEHIEIRCKFVPFRCFCGKGLQEKNEPHTHFPDLKIPKYKRGKRAIECSRCKQKFNYRETYQNHVLTCDADESGQETMVESIPDSSETAEAVEESYECDECSQVFTDKNSYKKHRYEHLPESKKNICDICGKCFASKGGLKAHRDIHSEIRSFICEHCGAGFNQKGNLMTHLKTSLGLCRGLKGVHSLMLECTTCKRSFTSFNRLKQHEKKHERVEKLISTDKLACSDCGKSFKTFHEVKRHRMTHSGEKPHACTFCSKSFAQKSNMMAHMRIHTGYRPYECYICGQAFTQGTNLKQHVEKMHDIKTYRFKRMPRGRKVRDTDAGEETIDIEMEYIENAKKNEAFMNACRNNANKNMVLNQSTLKKDMGTQASEDDDEEDEDDDDDDEEGIEIIRKEFSVKDKLTDRPSEEKKYLSEKVFTNPEDIPNQKIFFQIVHGQPEPGKDLHVSLDTTTLREVLTKTMLRPSREIVSIPKSTEVQKAYNITIPQNTTPQAQLKSVSSILSSSEKKIYSALPKQKALSSVQIVQPTGEVTENRMIQSEAEKSDQVHIVQTIVDSSGQPVVVIQPPSDNSNPQNDHTTTGNTIPSVELAKNSDDLNKTSISSPAYKAELYNPEAEAENQTAVAELQNEQNSLQNNPDKVATYEIMDETENRVEYVTVIFEDDGMETVEQEVGTSQTSIVSQGSDLTATPVTDLVYMENVSQLNNVSEVVTTTSHSGTVNLIQ